MTPISFLLATCLFFICSWLLMKRNGYMGKLPPGPRGVPLFGNLFQLGPRMHFVLQNWAKKYGSIFSIQLGLERVIVLDDYKLIREMFADQAFSGRPQNDVFLSTSEGSYGVLSTENEVWQTQRRFTLRHLRDFGFCKNYMENLILDEVREIIDWLKEEEVAGRVVSISRKLSLAVLNSLWTICSGTKYSQNDPTLTNILDNFIHGLNALSETGILLFAPWARHFAPGLTGWNAFFSSIQEMSKFIKKTVEQHISTYSGDHIRDFLDHYIQEVKSTKDTTSSFYGEEGLKHLTAVVGDLFQAGAETTSNTLAWAVLYLSSHPKIQEKLHEEIDRVVGVSSLPSLSDRAKMPYTEAVIYETLRFFTLLPGGVFHRALETKEFHGYTILKGSWIIANLYSVHYNKETWGDPEVFRRSRFLSVDGLSVVKHDALLAFLTGKRACLGELLAKDTLFLFIAFKSIRIQLTQR